MTLSEVCKTVNIYEEYLSEEGEVALTRIDQLAAALVEKMGVEKAKEIVELVGPGWELEFFTLLEDYIKKDH